MYIIFILLPPAIHLCVCFNSVRMHSARPFLTNIVDVEVIIIGEYPPDGRVVY